MIEIKNLKLLSHKMRLRLDIPQLSLNSQGIIAIVGHNGAGKSSLLTLIAGLGRPSVGSACWQGQDTYVYFEQLKEKIHLLSWNISLFQNLTALAHLELVKGISPIWNADLESELSRDFNVPLLKKVETLSRGEHAKLKLLLSLPRMPSVVLLDEITNDLDTDSRRSIFKKLDRYSYETKSQIIVATNMVDDIERYATFVVVLKGGCVVLSGNLDTIKEKQKSSFESIVRVYESAL